MEERGRANHPHTIRSRLILETASELVGSGEWAYLQARVSLREQGSQIWPVTLFGSDSPATLFEVASGRVQIAIINPASVLNMAVRGTGPFNEPLSLRAIAVIPSFDQMVFAVSADTGLTSITDIGRRRFPLKVSLRGQEDHSLHLVVREVVSAAGFSLEDIVAWGGEVRYDPGMAYSPNRIGAVERGEIHAIFDEAASSWANSALDLGMRFLVLEEAVLKRLEGLGLRRAVLETAKFPKLSVAVPTLDFSGWPIYTHTDTPDETITAFCRALDTRKDRIPWQQGESLPLEQMVRDTRDGPLEIPFHRAAERFWRERGYLDPQRAMPFGR